MWEMRHARRVLARKSQGKQPLERPKRRWEENIKIDLNEKVWELVDWTQVAPCRNRWRALVCTVMNLQVPYKRK
jgi:hypothetical protein